MMRFLYVFIVFMCSFAYKLTCQMGNSCVNQVYSCSGIDECNGNEYNVECISFCGNAKFDIRDIERVTFKTNSIFGFRNIILNTTNVGSIKIIGGYSDAYQYAKYFIRNSTYVNFIDISQPGVLTRSNSFINAALSIMDTQNVYITSGFGSISSFKNSILNFFAVENIQIRSNLSQDFASASKISLQDVKTFSMTLHGPDSFTMSEIDGYNSDKLIDLSYFNVECGGTDTCVLSNFICPSSKESLSNCSIICSGKNSCNSAYIVSNLNPNIYCSGNNSCKIMSIDSKYELSNDTFSCELSGSQCHETIITCGIFYNKSCQISNSGSTISCSGDLCYFGGAASTLNPSYVNIVAQPTKSPSLSPTITPLTLNHKNTRKDPTKHAKELIIIVSVTSVFWIICMIVVGYFVYQHLKKRTTHKQLSTHEVEMVANDVESSENDVNGSLRDIPGCINGNNTNNQKQQPLNKTFSEGNIHELYSKDIPKLDDFKSEDLYNDNNQTNTQTGSEGESGNHYHHKKSIISISSQVQDTRKPSVEIDSVIKYNLNNVKENAKKYEFLRNEQIQQWMIVSNKAQDVLKEDEIDEDTALLKGSERLKNIVQNDHDNEL